MLILFHRIKKSKLGAIIKSLASSPLGYAMVGLAMIFVIIGAIFVIININYMLVLEEILPILPFDKNHHCSENPSKDECKRIIAGLYMVLEVIVFMAIWGFFLLSYESYKHITRDLLKYEKDIIKYNR